MKIGLLGTGMVGYSLGLKLVELGHEVTMGSRTADNDSASAWVGEAGEGAAHSTFEVAARSGEIVINATRGVESVDALRSAGPDNLEGKLIIDVANPIVPGASPPELAYLGEPSLAERIQAEFPEARVVKALNTVHAKVMVDPARLDEPTTLFICGNDAEAKGTVRELLGSFGWEEDAIIDLGAVDAARATEGYLALWLRTMSVVGNPFFNLRIVREG